MHRLELLRALDSFQAIQQLLPAARLPAALPRLVAPDELLRMGDMRLLRLVFAQAPLHALLAQLQVA